MSSGQHSCRIVYPDHGKPCSWEQGTFWTQYALDQIFFFHMLGVDTTHATGTCATGYLPPGIGGLHCRGIHHTCASAMHPSSIPRRDVFAFGSDVGPDRPVVPSSSPDLHPGTGPKLRGITSLSIGTGFVHHLFRCATHI